MNTYKRMDGPILIAGCGYVGSRLASELLDSGATVLGLRRQVDLLPPGVRPVKADLADPGSLPEVPDLAGLVYAPSAGARNRDAYRRAYVEGVDRLADALGERAAGLARAIYVSSTAVFGDADGVVDESTPAVASSETSAEILDGEARFLARFPNALVLRFAGIYGPTRSRLVRQVASGGPFDVRDEVVGNRIHRDDCAGSLAHLLAHPAPDSLYVGVDDAPSTHGEVRAFLAKRLGLSSDGFETAAVPVGKRLSNARLRASGYVFRVPTFREGYPSIVDEVTSG